MISTWTKHTVILATLSNSPALRIQFEQELLDLFLRVFWPPLVTGHAISKPVNPAPVRGRSSICG